MVPGVCILDPNGDVVRRLKAARKAGKHRLWACHHTELYEFRHGGARFGIVGCAVDASLAALVARELFASGCWA